MPRQRRFKLLGIELVVPSMSDAILALAIATALGLVVLALNTLAERPNDGLSALFCAALAGAILAAFGVTVARLGWRATAIVAAACALLWGLRTLVGGLL